MKLLLFLILTIIPCPKVFVYTDGFNPADNVVVYDDSRLGAEAYAIDSRAGKTVIRSGGPAATFYARQTLAQITEQFDGQIPTLHIEDSPRFGHRGIELDCSRHFFSVQEIKKVLDIMARYKLNRFHWHLTDDHGWRAEIKKYPLLTEVGAWREGTMVGWDADSNDGIRYGGYYTQDQMREIVAYAAERFIEIIPEIDLPAHMVSALTAYPYLGCTGGPYSLMTVWDISKDVLCAGKESSFEFLEDVFDEICDIFPYEYIHIGGDECPKTRWENCPDCQARIRELGLADSGHATAEQYLQNYVTSRVQAILAAKGRKVIGWDEILEGELAPGATIMSWRGTEGGIKAATEGFDVVMTPCEYCYLDYCQGADPSREPISIGHYLPLEKVYSYDPVEGMKRSVAKHVLGVQGNLWTEFIAEDRHLEYMLLPRLLAISEVGWTVPWNKDYGRFEKNVIEWQFPYLEKNGYTFCREILRGSDAVDPYGYTVEDGRIVYNTPERPIGQQSMIGFAAPPIDTVRVGFIGLGMRGPNAVYRFTNIPGVRIVALCDLLPERVGDAQRILSDAGLPAADGYSGEDGWKALCERNDIDLVYLAVPWQLHTEFAVYAMECGHHVAVEVPAATSVKECWNLVNTAERTRRHCMMLENCVYDDFELTALNMARQGVFGEIVHVEGAYIHNLDPFWDEYQGDWRMKFNKVHRGDVYPTHGLGPVAMVLGIHRGDKMDYMVSMDTDSWHGRELSEARYGDSDYANGDHTGTYIRTHNGKTIEIQHDTYNPRPYSRMFQITGTRGFANKYPAYGFAISSDAPGVRVPGLDAESYAPDEAVKVLMEDFRHPLTREGSLLETAKRVGGHGGMDFIMDYRLIYCLRNGLPLDQDVYDAAEWSCLVELSEVSIRHGSMPVVFPDFTRGEWNRLDGVEFHLK